jgi:hypothetical protein
MARKTEQWWATHGSPAIARCIGTTRKGTRCLREAEPGSVVCSLHGGGAPQVRRRAAERVIHTADEAAQNLVKWMNDGSVPFGVRVKIAQDLMDRAGLIAAQVHKVVPVEAADPVETLFRSLLDDPDGLVTQPAAPPALEAGEVVEGQVLDPAQDAVDRYEESWQPDADLHFLTDRRGPCAVSGEGVESGDPRPAPPVPGWRPPDDVA